MRQLTPGHEEQGEKFALLFAQQNQQTISTDIE